MRALRQKLVMVGWWTGFPFWESFGVCAVGGILGVMYTVPLRRALVTQSDLPYPEGVAAAEILKVGAGSRAGEAVAENKARLLTVVVGAVASAAFAALVGAPVAASDVGFFYRAGPAATGLGASLSLALVGAGHLVGLSAGLAMLAGLAIAWGVATPILTALHPAVDSAADVWNGVRSALAAWRNAAGPGGDAMPRTERDLPIGLVALISVACLVPLGALLAAYRSGGALGGLIVPLTIGAIVYVVFAGFAVAAACGYMAGLIGSSNSPVSGLAILTVLGAALLLAAFAHGAGAAAGTTLVAYALFFTAVVLCVATIANDNLQNLKTGQLVDATPWRQQVALIVGVIMGALVIPPILDLLNRAYGFAGSPIHGASGSQPLPAPQATLISALAQGVIQGKLDWDASTTVPVILGAILGHFYDRAAERKRDPDAKKRFGVLLASGLIVGEAYSVLRSRASSSRAATRCRFPSWAIRSRARQTSSVRAPLSP